MTDSPVTQTAVREKPILFSGEMVRAILDGRKQQTRRVVKPQPSDVDGATCFLMGDDLRSDGRDKIIQCPFGQPGDRLWVREAFALNHSIHYAHNNGRGITGMVYRASWPDRNSTKAHPFTGDRRWRPSIHMPRAVSRLTLEITEVRVQRLDSISEEDARAGGASFEAGGNEELGVGYRIGFRTLWDTLHKSRGYGWESNPWVFAITFKQIGTP